MRRFGPTVLAAVLLTAPTLAATAAGAEPSPSPTSSVGSTPIASVSPTTEPSDTPSSTSSSSPSSTTTPSSTAVPTQKGDLSFDPGTGPRLSNALLSGSCGGPLGGEDAEAQWHVKATLSVDGKPLTMPLFFATEYDGTFVFSVSISGSDGKTPTPGNLVVVTAECGDPVEPGPQVELVTSFRVDDAPTCADELPEPTAFLDQDVAWVAVGEGDDDDDTFDEQGRYAGDGWLPGSDVLVCYYEQVDGATPEFAPIPVQRFAGATADADGRVSTRTITRALVPTDPSVYAGGEGDYDDGDYDEGEYDEGEYEEFRAGGQAVDEDPDGGGDHSDEEDGDGDGESGDQTQAPPQLSDLYDAWAVVAVVGTGTDGAPRVLAADVTPMAVPVSGTGYDPGGSPGPSLAATGGDHGRWALTGSSLVLIGLVLVAAARQRRSRGGSGPVG